MSKITEFYYTVECFQNGERTDFMRGREVQAAPGHHYYAEFGTLEEAQEDMRRLRDEFFMRDGGEYDRILDDQGEEAADKARAEFVANGSICDDLNFYGIRMFERICLRRSSITNALANNEGEDYDDVCSALNRFGIEYDIHDESDFAGEDDPRESATEANENDLGDVEDAKLFVEICE